MSLNLDNLYFRMTSNSASESHCLSCEVNRNLFFEPVSLGVYLQLNMAELLPMVWRVCATAQYISNSPQLNPLG